MVLSSHHIRNQTIIDCDNFLLLYILARKLGMLGQSRNETDKHDSTDAIQLKYIYLNPNLKKLIQVEYKIELFARTEGLIQLNQLIFQIHFLLLYMVFAVVGASHSNRIWG